MPAPTAKTLSLNQTQAAKAVGVSDRTFRRWERKGIVKGRRVQPGGVKLYGIGQLQALSEVSRG